MLSFFKTCESSRYAVLALTRTCDNVVRATYLCIVVRADDSTGAVCLGYVPILYNLSLSLILIMLDTG